MKTIKRWSKPLLLAVVLGMGTGCASVKVRMAADSSYKDGMSQMDTGDNTTAIETFQAGIAMESTSKETNAHLYAGLAKAYVRDNRLDAAVEAAAKGVRIYSDNITQLALSEALLLTRDSQASFDAAKAAVEHCNMVAHSNPDLAKRCYLDGYLALGRVVRAVGNYDYAIEQFEAAQQNGAKESRIIAEIAQVEILKGNVAQGMLMANKALEKDPESKEALLARGTGEAISGDATKARETLEPLLAKNPIATLEFLRVARSFVSKQDFDRAVEMYEMVALIQPNNPHIWMDLGFTYERIGDMDSATTAYQKVLANADSDVQPYISAADTAAYEKALLDSPPESDRLTFLATAYSNLGTVLMAKSDVDGALDAFARANLADPSDLSIAVAVSDLYNAKGEGELAVSTLEASLPEIKTQRTALESDMEMDAEAKTAATADLNKKEAEMEKRLGILLYNQKRQEEAAPHLARAVELAPEDPNIQMGLGVVYFNSEKYEEALPHLEKANDAMPNDRGLLLYLGVSYRRTGANNKAVKYLEMAKKLDPRNKDIYLELHHAYKAIGKSTLARDHLLMYQSL